MIPLEADTGPPIGAELPARNPVLDHVERWVVRTVGALAAVAVVAEVAILLVGVIARFGFNSPLTWGDELASIVFLWLAMLGSVLALWNGEHMRLTTIASRLPPRGRVWAEALATLAPLLLLVLLIGPAYDYMQDQSFVETPALGWPDAVRAAAVPTGFILMIVVSALRLLEFRVRDVLGVVAILGALALVLSFATPVFRAWATGV